MKQKIIKIAKDLEEGKITTMTAKSLLLCLFDVSYSCLDEEFYAVKCPKCGSTDVMMTDRGFHTKDKCLECGEWF